MRTNLSSQISLNRVSTKYYKPSNAIERSVLTQREKIPTDIYETIEEATNAIVDGIVAKIQEKQREGKFCTIGAGVGTSVRPIYNELVRRYKEEGVSFRNVVLFN
ncbi:MAG: glucosamine-6-phosphate deaminase, partial [Phocaeicola sp.]